ncbi:MAG: hypothetical protein R3185_07205, partial [Candidatus Thermoplasmatota archaeon]|nr:hypothetical protein [Candidatus Thermoplasmatota archaeon]
MHPAVGLAALLLLPALAGCLSPGPADAGDGIVVTGQPLVDAALALGVEDQLAGIPDWTILDAPLPAERLGRPFVLPAEEVLALQPGLVLDQPHPLTSGPEREGLATALAQAGVP